MTMKVKIENQDASRTLVITPYDESSLGARPVRADPIVLLPGQSTFAYVHELRFVVVNEGEAVRAEVAPLAAAAPVEGDATAEGDAAAA